MLAMAPTPRLPRAARAARRTLVLLARGVQIALAALGAASWLVG